MYTVYIPEEEKKKRKSVQNSSYHCNTTNKLWRRSGRVPREKRGWNKGKHKIKPTRGEAGREWAEMDWNT